MSIKPLNPATPAATVQERKRIPMSVPVQKLEVADIPGYHQHWFMGTEDRIARALTGGYEFVDERDAKPFNISLGGDSTASGNTDMGSRVSIVAGTELGRDGQPIRMILMKIRLELYEEDKKLVEDRNDAVANALTGGMIGAMDGSTGETADDVRLRRVDKVRTKIPDMFNKHKRKRAS